MIHMINHVSAVQVNTILFQKKKKNHGSSSERKPVVERMYFFSGTHTSLDIKCRCCTDYAQIHSGESDSASRRKNEAAGMLQRRHRRDLSSSCGHGGRLGGRAAAVPELWPSLHPGNRWGCGRGVWKRRIELRRWTPHVGNALPS